MGAAPRNVAPVHGVGARTSISFVAVVWGTPMGVAAIQTVMSYAPGATPAVSQVHVFPVQAVALKAFCPTGTIQYA